MPFTHEHGERGFIQSLPVGIRNTKSCKVSRTTDVDGWMVVTMRRWDGMFLETRGMRNKGGGQADQASWPNYVVTAPQKSEQKVEGINER